MFKNILNALLKGSRKYVIIKESWMNVKKITSLNENEKWVIEKWKSSKLPHIDVPNLIQSMLLNLYRWIKTLRGYTQKLLYTNIRILNIAS